ncbi:MAG: RNA polymerase sigma factor [Chloroflexota bacterium]
MEKQWLIRAQQLDEAALAEIYDRYSDDLYRYAMRKLGDRQQAEECVSETFMRFLQALHRGRGPRDHLRAYLYRIAHNWITDQYRTQPPPSDSIDDVQIGDDSDLNLSLEQQQDRAKVRQAMAQLTPDQQQVISLKYFEGWKNREVAQALQKPTGAIKSLQHRALGALQRILLAEEVG